MHLDFSGKRNLALSLLTAMIAIFSLVGCQKAPQKLADLDLNDGQLTSPIADEEGHLHDDGESLFALSLASSCAKAKTSQVEEVDRGNKLYSEFLNYCISKTGESQWCKQLTRPNPDSADIFECTYGKDQTHRFVHPDKTTWKYAVMAVRLIDEMEDRGIEVKRIYNWWRPEPYNKNVDGAAGRHPYGTAVDVEFESQKDKNLAFKYLCRQRGNGRINAVGYYPSLGLHLGVGDRIPNTWGRSCH